MGVNGEKGRAFDFIVPTGRWVHLAIVATLSTESEITLYADGVAVDTISKLRLSLPMGCLGAGPHAQEGPAATNGGGSFVGLLAQTRWGCLDGLADAVFFSRGFGLGRFRLFVVFPCLSLPRLALPCLALPCLALPCLALPCLAFSFVRVFATQRYRLPFSRVR